MDEKCDIELKNTPTTDASLKPSHDEVPHKKPQVSFQDGSGHQPENIVEVTLPPDDDDVFEDKVARKSTFKRFFSTRKSKKNPSDEGGVENNFADVLLNPTKPSHLGIFRYMPFEHQERDETKSITSESEHGELTLKEKLRHILHSKAIHLIVIVLVLIDSILVVVELLFDLGIIGPESGEHVVREIFHGFSIGILTMFMIELVLKVWADRHHFIRHKIEVLDGFVVTVSWVLDIVLVFINSVVLLVTELILLLRLWRIFRIVNGIIVAVKTKADERVQFYKQQSMKMAEKLVDAEEKIKVLEKDMERLHVILEENGIKVSDRKI